MHAMLLNPGTAHPDGLVFTVLNPHEILPNEVLQRLELCNWFVENLDSNEEIHKYLIVVSVMIMRMSGMENPHIFYKDPSFTNSSGFGSY